jgi:translation initiation factor IF-2
MAEKKTRRKLFKVAKELNLSHHTIIEFLEKKGHKVSGLNTSIEDEVYDEILKRFSQEKVKAEKLARRKKERQIEEEVAVATAEPPQEEVEPETVVEEQEETKLPAEEEAETTEVPEPEEEEETEPEEIPAEAEKETAEQEVIKEPEESEVQEEAETVAVEEKEVTPDETEEQLEAEAAETEEAEEEKPQIGDIIDHPQAKKFIEKQKEKAQKKRERKKKKIKEIKKGDKEEKKKKEKELVPKRIRAMEEEEVEAADMLELTKEEQETQSKKKKDRKKKDYDEDLSEKEKRRRKAFEMIRKEGRVTRTKMPAIDLGAEEEEGVREDRRRRSRKKKEVDQQEVEDTVKKTLASMQDAGTGKRKRKKTKTTDGEAVEGEENVINVTEFITVQDLANLMSVPANEVIKKCLELGQMVTINQRLDMDMIKLLAEDFGFVVQEEEEFASDYLEDVLEEEETDTENLEPRHPIVTVMGHVDHGKTSLLDHIRNTNVVAGESGGITQHIGAYVVETDDGRKITFLDTPGHEAFTAMRSRGAQVTDLVVLVIAADDRVMPQTEEAIDHAKAAGVPIVIAINKIDKPGANPQAIRKDLADRDILVEDWGGNYQVVDVSAKTGEGIPDLMEKILLEAEILELKANPKKRAVGVVIESRLDKGKGPVATVLIQQGALSTGDDFIVGQYYGRVRALLNEREQRVDDAGPGYPVQVLGIDGVPEAGDKLIVMPDEKRARDIAIRRQQLKREQDFRQIRLLTLDEISRQIKEGRLQELNLIVKADVDGSTQALTDALHKLSNQDVAVKVVRRAVGPITESDIMLAAASQAIIIGFHVRPTLNAKELADEENVDIRLYKVIYDAIEDVKLALEGLLEPEERENVLGLAEVREVFKISQLGSIAVCYVLNVKINRNARVRLIRNDVEIYEGRISSLKRFKEDTREVGSGYECGIMIENYNDIKVADHIEAFEVVHEKRTLEPNK